MRTNDIKDLKTKSIEELKSMVQNTRNDLFTLKMDIMKGKEKNAKQISHRKDDIARMLTISKEKEMENVNKA